jgi:hypothetical protein
MLVYDNITISASNRKVDKNGFLKVKSCNITKEQVAPYYGSEIPNWREFGLDSKTIYYVYRPEAELAKAADTFNNLPLTREHIEVAVDDVPKERIVGSLGDRAEYKAPYLTNSLMVYDKTDIDNILNGNKKELSCGYRYTPVKKSGEWHGQHYDFVMTDIVGNHVALVKEGRAGHDVVVADSKPVFEEKGNTMTDITEDEFIESEHPRAKNGQFTNKGGEGSSGSKMEFSEYKNAAGEKSMRASFEHNGAKVDAIKEGKYVSMWIYAPEGKKFDNGDTFYTTEAEADKAEELAKKIIDSEFGGSGSKEDDWQEQAKKADKGYTIAHKDKDGNNTVIAEVHKEDISEESPKKSQFNWKNDGLGKHLTFTRGNSKVVLRESGEVRSYMNGKLMPLLNDKVEDVEEYAKHQIELGYKLANDKAIPDEQDKPETAGEEKAETKESKMTEDKEALAEEKKAKDEKDIEGKEKKAFAEGVDYGEEKEKSEPKKLDSEHESEGTKKADEKKKEEKEAEDKCTKDSALTMDIDTIKAQVREEVIADFKAREEARKSVESIVGEINVMAFDSCSDIYKLACEKEGLPVNEIVSYKDALTGYLAGKSKLTMDASPVSGSNEECFKDIRV